MGSSVESVDDATIIKMFSNRIKYSLINIVSPKQNLSFSQLKIYYEEKSFEINENFLMQLNFYTSDNKFNYLAYLLSDNNDISIKVASY